MPVVRSLALGLLVSVTVISTASADAISSSSRYFADALINMSAGPDYAQESSLTAGGAAPWYESPVVERFYGGEPDAGERREFVATVINRVIDTYNKSGLGLTITDNPNDDVPHTLSVVSGTYSPSSPDAVGISTIGGSGFSFIDRLGYASSLDELQWAVAHNVAHELMHAFGGEHHDTTGDYLDAAVTDWNTLVDPDATFSRDAVAELMTKDFRDPYAGYAFYGLYNGFGAGMIDADGHDHDVHATLMAAPVPEPTTIGIWALGGLGILLHRNRRARAGTRRE